MRTLQWPLATLACFGMVLSPSFQAMGVAQEPAARPVVAGQKAAATLDLIYVPASAVGALVLHPQQILAGENADWMPVEVITAAGLQNVGFDPTQIQEAIGVIAPPDMSNPPKPRSATGGHAPRHAIAEPSREFGAILRFSQAYSRRDVFAKLQPMAPVVKEIDGKKFALLGGPTPLGIYMPDDRTLLVGTDGFLQQMIAATAVDSDLTKLLKSTDCSGTATAIFSLDAMRDLINQAMAHAPPVPPPFADFLKIPTLVSSGVIKADFRDPGEMSATLHTADAKSAEELQQLIERGIEMGRQIVQARIAHSPDRPDDPVQQASQKYLARISGHMFDHLKPTRDGSDIKWSVAGANGPAANVAVIGILMSLLLPAVQAAREAARRNQSANNLKQLGLSLLNYESAYRQFPARAIFSKEGTPLLSWRVQMLPYLDEGALYKEFHLDEAWDSPHNLPLVARMPATFADPNDPAPGKTHYVVPVGKGLMFDGDKGTRIADITDGTSKTILAVEADNAVIWTKPDDLDVDLDKPFNGLGNLRPGGFPAVFGDDHTSFISDAMDPATLKALFTKAGGEVIDRAALP